MRKRPVSKEAQKKVLRLFPKSFLEAPTSGELSLLRHLRGLQNNQKEPPVIGPKLKKIFLCYTVLADGMLAYGNAYVTMNAVTQENLNAAIQEITDGIHESNPEMDFQNVTIIFMSELEG
jgi:hypothetical protein